MAVSRIGVTSVAIMLSGMAFAQNAVQQPGYPPLKFTLGSPPVAGFPLPAMVPPVGAFLAQAAAPPPAAGSAAPVAPVAAAPVPAASGEPTGACLPVGRQLPADRVAALTKNPRLLLEQYTLGGGGLSGEIRSAIATAPELVEPILSLIGGANINQKTAIGVGLATAALACVEKRPDVAGLIQARLLALAERDVLLAFNAASGTTATAATGFSGGAGAGQGSGPGPALGTSGDTTGAYGGLSFQGSDVARGNLFNATVGSFSDSLTSTTTTRGGSVSPTSP
jgi:hypothetical protein